jgi:hypothetical protein
VRDGARSAAALSISAGVAADVLLEGFSADVGEATTLFGGVSGQLRPWRGRIFGARLRETHDDRPPLRLLDQRGSFDRGEAGMARPTLLP